MLLHLFTIQFLFLPLLAAASLPPIHWSISRRGGSFPAPDIANLTYLLSQLQLTESRFTATRLDSNDNKLVRKPRPTHGTQGSTILLGEPYREGNWFANIMIGEPPQVVDLDLDMLTNDWWVLSTHSPKGSLFLDFKSSTYVDSESPLSFPTCREPTDVVHLPTVKRSVPISFAHCRPAKQWIRSLLPSGAYLGLAPGSPLSQTTTISLLPQLMEKGIVDIPIFSLMLENGNRGVFSAGGMSVGSDIQGKNVQDDRIKTSNHEEMKRDESLKRHTAHPSAATEVGDWKWSKVQGPEGWWQIIMREMWIEGAKVLYDQPVVFDINTPFIIAPSLAARSFYSSISGSRQLPPPYDQFHAYPCFNFPRMHFEFDHWKVQVLKGKRDEGTYSPGGRFSLGRLAKGSGYCVGIVVESRMGDEGDIKDAKVGEDGGFGLADLWVLGEPIFQDVQVAFDWKEKKVGMQRRL